MDRRRDRAHELPFDWGRGQVPRVATYVAVMVLLALNTVALLVSPAYVIDGIPRTYRSSLEGSFDLPYIPEGNRSIGISAPRQVVVGCPFTIDMDMGQALPYGYQYLIFEGSDGTARRWRVNQAFDGGSWHLRSRPPGLAVPGEYALWLQGLDGPGGLELFNLSFGVIEAVADATGTPAAIPDIPPDWTLEDPLSLEFLGNATEADCRIDGGERFTVRSVDGTASVDIRGIGPGWHALTMIVANGSMPDTVQLFNMGYGPGDAKEAPDLELVPMLRSADGAYSQDPEASMKVLASGIDMLEGGIYRISLAYLGSPAGEMSDDASVLMDYIPGAPQGVRFGDRIYPAVMSDDGSEHMVTLIADPDAFAEDGAYLLAGPLLPGSPARIRDIEVTIFRDRSIALIMEPDPFVAEGIVTDGPLKMTITDEGYDLGSKRFPADPVVTLDGVPLRAEEDDTSSYWTYFDYEIATGNWTDGGRIGLDAGSEFQYDPPLLVLLPFPPFIAGIPVGLSGVAGVSWFIILTCIIIASIGALLVSEVRAGALRPKRGGIDAMTVERSPFLTTSMIYSSIIFASLASVILFGLLERATPVPSTLSDQTPIHFRMFMLAEASVWEEVITRVLYIGVPLTIMGIVRGRKGGIAGGLLGGVGRIGLPEAVLMILSALLFGLAHVSGWGFWKALPTFMAGLLFGYLFVRVGVHASIIVHFLIDYASFFWEIVDPPFGIIASYTMLVLMVFVLGAMNLAVLMARAATVVRSRSGRVPLRAILASVHSLASIGLALAVLSKGIATPLVVPLFGMPVAYAAWWALSIKRVSLARWVVAIMSIGTLVLSPLGLAFVMMDEDDGSADVSARIL